jgi:hypothetical protein
MFHLNPLISLYFSCLSQLIAELLYKLYWQILATSTGAKTNPNMSAIAYEENSLEPTGSGPA